MLQGFWFANQGYRVLFPEGGDMRRVCGGQMGRQSLGALFNKQSVGHARGQVQLRGSGGLKTGRDWRQSFWGLQFQITTEDMDGCMVLPKEPVWSGR